MALPSAHPFSCTGHEVQFDEQTCEQARLNRDARFDGRIFIGVTSTGVYCRPVCPAPHAKRAHVQYFPTAAAAATAGFRPCLRCRPEVAPGTPAWNGTATTVSRGLRLIAEGALDEDGVEALAERLGVTSRHLSRLFLRHLGALPTTVARIRRLHFAKQLISDTTLSMAQIATGSGFGSIRRFNDVFRELYGRAPSELRRLGRRPGIGDHEYVFHLAYRPPYDWDSLLVFLAARSTPGVEAICDGIYRRAIMVRDVQGILEVGRIAERHTLRIHIHLTQPVHLLQVISRVRTMFDLAADPEVIHRHLSRDHLLAPLLDRHPGLRLVGAWDPFEAVVQALLGQSFAPDEVGSLMDRLVRRHGEPLTVTTAAADLRCTFPRPAALAAGALSFMPQSAARMIRAAAQVMCAMGHDGSLDELLSRLRGIEGIDESAIQYVALRVLNDPDAFPAGDEAVMRAVVPIFPSQGLPQHVDGWRPWRGYAAMVLMCAAGELQTAGRRRAAGSLEGRPPLLKFAARRGGSRLAVVGQPRGSG